jgi:hypothetical protein
LGRHDKAARPNTAAIPPPCQRPVKILSDFLLSFPASSSELIPWRFQLAQIATIQRPKKIAFFTNCPSVEADASGVFISQLDGFD